MTPEKIVENHKKYVLQSWSKQGNLNPIPVAKADGIYFYDFDGNRYTDMSSQLVNLNLGYGNKATDYAIIGVKAERAMQGKLLLILTERKCVKPPMAKQNAL